MPTVGYAVLQIIPSVRGIGDDLRRQLIGPAADAGGQAGDAAGGNFKDKLKAGAAAAGLAAGALVAKGLQDALAQADATSTLQAQLGATGPEAAKYGKVAGKLYASGVTENFQEAADAIKQVVQGGLAPPGATNAQLQEIATKASDVANVFGQDLGGVTNAVSQLMRTGLAKNSSEAFDLVTKGFQSGTDKAGDFLDTVNEYGTQFRKAGLDGSSAIGLLNQAIKGGARDADIAADAIKEFSIRAVDGSKTSADGFKALGLNADDMAAKFAKGGKSANGVLDLTLDKLRGVKDPVKQSQIAVQLFGTQAEDLGKALFAMDPSAAAAGLGKVGGAAKAAGDTIRSGPSHAITTFSRALQQDLVNVIGKYVIPIITKIGHAVGPVMPYLLPISGAILAIVVAVKAWSVAQAIWNAVMAANPIVLIVAGLVALGVGLYVAYKRSETFRSIVQTAFKAVADAGLWLWNSVLKPVIGFAVAGFKLWWSAVKLYFAFVVGAFKTVGDAAVWLWQNAISPTINFIVGGFKLWWAGVKLYFGLVRGIVRTVGDVFTWLWKNAISPAFNGAKTVISNVWNTGIKGVFNTMKTAVGLVGKAFEAAKDAIKLAWDKLKGIAKAPVKFVIDTVFNNGIVKVWNAVAGTFGAPKLSAIKGFATGGVLPGYTPGRDVHLAALSGGEAVMRPEWTRAVGPAYVNTMNAAARGGGVSAVRRMVSGGLPAFADGGIFGWVKSAASKGVDLVKSGVSWLKDGIKASAVAGLNKVVKPLIDKIAGSASAYRDMISGVPKRMIKTIVGFSGEADKKMSAAGIGGGGYARALSWARAQNGKPYIWGGVGPAGFDCSGFMGAIEGVIRGQRPNVRRWATGAFGSSGPAGWVRNARSPFMIGITNAGVGHTAGTLNGVNVESRGGDGVVIGKSARGYSSSLFTSRWGFVPGKYDSGGWLRPGITAAVNATGQPEAVLTAGQWRVMSGAASAAGRLDGMTVNVYVGNEQIRDITRAEVLDSQRQLIAVLAAS
ncbi:phage tail tape measure protein [Streptomyces sp. NPDC013178]|uniref:phage tail tape measure protein n=1 Tax=Streptomyces sp. NPDC013178 TaxID=3155118 RepID=UPI0033CEFAF9